MLMSYLFLRTAWMKHYQGVTDDDLPVGAGAHVQQFQDGGEVYNFKPIRGKYYGFARIHGGANLKIERLGAKKLDSSIKNITVVFFSRNPETGGQYIVGWYKNATVYKEVRLFDDNRRGNQNWCVCEAKVAAGYLVVANDRMFKVPDDGPGQTNAWYVEEYYNGKKYLAEVERYINNPLNYRKQKPKTKGGSGWQKDVKLRQKVEWAAMEEVAKYFEDRNYDVSFRHKENLGWDMEAISGRQTLLLEVKGLSGDFSCVDFTPNEYSKSKAKRKDYRICVVSNALNKNKSLDIFFNADGQWITTDRKQLNEQEIISARFHYNP